jgi:ISXO2-like transposase domain
MTDEASAYRNLDLPHQLIGHGALEYVRGEVHTNTVENYWSLLKRGIIGSFHQVSVKHLPRYLGSSPIATVIVPIWACSRERLRIWSILVISPMQALRAE